MSECPVEVICSRKAPSVTSCWLGLISSTLDIIVSMDTVAPQHFANSESEPPEPPSPRSCKTFSSTSTLSSQECITEGLRQGQEKLKDDPYFASIIKRDKQLALGQHFLDGKRINPKMRTKLIKWLQELIEDYQFKLETYFLAVTILDKYLHLALETPKELQLVGACALYISSKICETKPVLPSVYVYSSGESFDSASLLSKEKQILISLGFNLSFPHVSKFIKAFKNVSQLQYQQCERVMILLGQSVQCYKYSRLELAKMIILLVKSGCQVTSNEELESEMHRVEGFIDF